LIVVVRWFGIFVVTSLSVCFVVLWDEINISNIVRCSSRQDLLCEKCNRARCPRDVRERLKRCRKSEGPSHNAAPRRIPISKRDQMIQRSLKGLFSYPNGTSTRPELQSDATDTG
jgi:hypothetical protein